MNYFCIKHCTDRGVLAKQCPCSLCWMSRWKLRARSSASIHSEDFIILKKSLLALKIWIKGSGSAVLVKNWRQILISKCHPTCWYKLNGIDSQKFCIFYLKCSNFFSSFGWFFSEHFLVNDKMRHHPSNLTEIKIPSDLSLLSLPRRAFPSCISTKGLENRASLKCSGGTWTN